MSDNLPPLPTPEAWRTRVGPWGDHSTDYAYTVNQMREYAAVAVAAALSDRHALQGRGEHPAPCARQCEAQAFRGEIAAEQRRSEMYADLVRRTAEALGLTREDGWHKLPERVAVLCDANERFGQRQEWWTEQMFALEQERDALKAEVKALREAGQQALRLIEDEGHKADLLEAASILRAALAEQDDDLTAAWMAGAAEARKRAEQPQPLTDKEILSAVGWERAEMYMQLLPNFPANEAKQETLKNARAVEAEVIRRMGVQR